MQTHSANFVENASAALADNEKVSRRDVLSLFTPLMRDAAISEFASFEALKRHVKAVRQHSLENLAHYLEAFENQAVLNGNSVHFASDAHQMNQLVLDICLRHNAQRVIKGKSMVTEETQLNTHLQEAGLAVVETDLGEYIVQQAGETPSHIVGPALHKSEQEIREQFLVNHPLGNRELATTADLVNEARQVLRQHFLEADIGIIGSNALVAENGYSMLVTNEGNGDLCANLPPVLIVCTTIDRILPRGEDATAMLRLLVRSATGQPQTCYTSFYSGPRRATDTDGPIETHFVLLDNSRTDIRAGDFREILECIRCGACLNHCPIYISAGGHAYGSVYGGPMGSVLTPLLTSLEASAALPNACTSCGRCAEVCPADIPLPDLLRDLRAQEREKKLSPRRWRWALRLHATALRSPRFYRWCADRIIAILHQLGKGKGSFRRLIGAGGWSAERDFPVPEGETFMQQYRKRQAASRRSEQ